MEIRLYDYQEASVAALRENFRRGIRSQILAAPTGAGKTEMGMHLLKECERKGTRAVFVVDRIPLIEQTSARADLYGLDHGVIQADHWRNRPWKKIQIASIQTLARRALRDRPDLVIMDECHTLYKTAVSLIATGVRTVGLSATPFTKGLGRHYQSVVSVTTTNKLIEAGRLSPYRIFAASEPDMSGAKVVAGEWTEDEAAKRSMPIIGDCVAEYLKHANGKKFIAFGCTVAHCEEMQRQFLAAGVQSALYTYHTGDEERRRMVDEFRKPDSYIRGLISVAALSKGFDVSDVECIIIARPLRSSLAEHIQMFGRGLRSHPGKAECIMLDHAGNTQRFWEPMQDFFENGTAELDDGSKKEKKTREAGERKPRKCPQCHHVHDPKPFCPACGHEYPKRLGVTHEAGELSEVGSGSSVPRESKQDVYSQLLFIARHSGYSAGWVAHRYKERFGVWPRGLREEPKVASNEIRAWVLHRIIAFSKGQKRARR